VATLEKELKQRTLVLFWLRNYIPQHALLGLLSGFFNSEASYMMDVFTDPTGHEKGLSREEGGIIHRLQVRQNETIRTCLRIGREEQVGSEKILKKAKIPSIAELSVRSNCMTAWRSFAEQGDMKELAIPRVKLQSHGRNTRSAAAGKIIQETVFPVSTSEETANRSRT
jgi:hypothetical protein